MAQPFGLAIEVAKPSCRGSLESPSQRAAQFEQAASHVMSVAQR